MDKMAEAMMQVPSRVAQDNIMSKTPKPNEVVTSETGKDKVGKAKTTTMYLSYCYPQIVWNQDLGALCNCNYVNTDTGSH